MKKLLFTFLALLFINLNSSSAQNFNSPMPFHNQTTCPVEVCLYVDVTGCGIPYSIMVCATILPGAYVNIAYPTGLPSLGCTYTVSQVSLGVPGHAPGVVNYFSRAQLETGENFNAPLVPCTTSGGTVDFQWSPGGYWNIW